MSAKVFNINIFFSIRLFCVHWFHHFVKWVKDSVFLQISFLTIQLEMIWASDNELASLVIKPENLGFYTEFLGTPTRRQLRTGASGFWVLPGPSSYA